MTEVLGRSRCHKGGISCSSPDYPHEDVKPVYLLADANSCLRRAEDNAACITNVLYRELVGCLMYIVTFTRRDIADAVGNVAKYCEQHTSEHWLVVKRVLKFW